MKKLFLLIASIVMLATFTSCQNNEIVSTSITISKSEINTGASGIQDTITLEANNYWTSVQTDWCTISPNKGEAGTTIITISVRPNSTIENREYIIGFTCLDKEVQLTVKQNGMSNISSSQAMLNFTSAAQSSIVQITGNCSYSTISDSDWLSANTDAYGIAVNVTENNSLNFRTGYITVIDAEGKTHQQITVNQAANTVALPSGSDFRDKIKAYMTAERGIKEIKFIANSDVTSNYPLVEGKIYLYRQNLDILEIHTLADEFVADKSCAYMFQANGTEFQDIEKINFGPDFNTENVEDMRNMFEGQEKLQALDLSSFNTSKVTNMESMFSRCKGLTNLDLSNFNTSSVTTMYKMFQDCNALQTLNVTSFNTAKVNSMSAMFQYCDALSSLDITNFSTNNVEWMDWMFDRCKLLTKIDVTNFNTDKVKSMAGLFANCHALKEIDLSNFNTSNVEVMEFMFGGCNSLNSLDLNSFNTDKVTTMRNMFNGCNNLTELKVENFNTTSVTSMEGMFNGCKAITELDIRHFNTTNVNNMMEMFQDCHKLKKLDINNYNTINVTHMARMFNNCYVLEELKITSFNTSNVEYFDGMFCSCRMLKELKVNHFNTEDAVTMNSMFEGCEQIAKLDVSNFKTSKVNNFWGMFKNCQRVEELDLTNFTFSAAVQHEALLENFGMNSATKPAVVKIKEAQHNIIKDKCYLNEMFAKFDIVDK